MIRGIPRPDAGAATPAEPIAIIGLACRYGGAPNLAAFWDMLAEGREGTREYPKGRTPELDAFYASAGSDLGPPSSMAGFLPNIDLFDAEFFGISSREAELMDPQQRLLLEVAWEALQDGGQLLSRVAGPRTGVFVGVWTSDYERLVEQESAVADVRSTVCNALFGASGRVAFAFDCRGPEASINAGCASSLVAVHQAVRALRSGECDLALTGGANAILRPEITQAFARADLLSQDGRCKFGDAGADGFVRSDGAGMVVLKRLADARADRDRIYAVIRGTAINNSGASSSFLMRPSEAGQAQVIEAALADAGVSPGQLEYVEAHGTGTHTGDRVELNALSDVVGRHPGRVAPCPVGSVKSNIGHTEAAAGVAGLIKTALAISKAYLPATLHVRTPNPDVDWDRVGLVLNRRGRAWPAGPRYAGVSSFGLTGANAHVVLEAPPPDAGSAEASSRPLLLPLSAASPQALTRLAQSYADALDGSACPADLLFTAAKRRSPFPHRLAVSGGSAGEVAQRLRRWATTGEAGGGCSGIARDSGDALCMVFAGQGSQWIGMGRELLQRNAVFRDCLHACDAAIAGEAGWSPLRLLNGDAALAAAGIDKVQPILFAIQVALAAVWKSWGVAPSVVIGHSMGEVAAAHVAGALSLADAVAVICRRSRLMSRFTGQGAMLLVELSMQEAAQAIDGLEDRLSVAASNGPRATVLAGQPEAVASVGARLESSVFCRPIAVDVAAHSPQMDEIRGELEAALGHIRPRAGHTAVFSTTWGRLTDGAGFDAGYWAENLRNPVLFHPAIERLLSEGCRNFIEAGPHPILLPPIEETARSLDADALTIASTRRDESELGSLTDGLGRLFVRGYPVGWGEFYPEGRVVDAPMHPWTPRRHWIEHRNLAHGTVAAGGHPLLPPPFKSADGSATWTISVDARALPWLKDHGLRGTTLLPASAYVELMTSAAAHVVGAPAVSGLRLREAVSILPERPVVLQLDLRLERPGRWAARLQSEDESTGSWSLAATATIQAGTRDARPLSRDDLGSFAGRDRGLDDSGRRHAEHLAALGYDFGPNFQCIRWSASNGEELRAEAHLADASRASGYAIHPALLDAGFQGLASLLLERRPDLGPIIPSSLETATIRAEARSARAAYVIATVRDTAALEGDVRLYSADGTVLCEVLALRFTASSSAAAEPALLHQLAWIPGEAHPGSALPGSTLPDRWLIFGDAGGTGAQVADALVDAGYPVELIEARSADKDRFRECIAPFDVALDRPRLGVIHFGSLDLGPESPVEAVADTGAEIAALAAGLEESGADAQLVLMTRGAAGTAPAARVCVPQASTWGLGAVIANEIPGLRCRLVDLDPAGEAAETAAIVRELEAGSDARVALRGGQRLVARLDTLQPSTSPRTRGLRTRERMELTVRDPGRLDSLAAVTGPRAAPPPGSVEIEVRATGLNFLDVMRALAVFEPPSALAPRLGIECAGVVVGVGRKVTEFAPGDRVVAISPVFQEVGTLASHLTTPATLVAKIPMDFSFAEAAALPCAYLTAYYALAEVARVRRGETILVHSGTGGVGLAALEVARWLEASVIATAGSPEKRALLRDRGVAHVLDSRAERFAEEVTAITRGRGVDVVLNSLAGSAIPEGLSALAPYGRFVEIGKRDMWSDTQIGLGAFLHNRSFAGVDLATFVEDHPRQAGALLRRIVKLVEAGSLSKLPVTVFPAALAADALHRMAQAKHVGKLVIDMAGAEVPLAAAAAIRPGAAYLITGGFGALGLLAAETLVARGATNLILCGRREPSPAASAAIAGLERRGARVRSCQIDIADEARTRELLDELRAAGPPLTGVIHSAGVLDDGLMRDLTPARFKTAMAGKVAGALLLDRLTAEDPIDLFVMFSSAAGLLGSPGQGNYAAANAMLDALAQDRAARGLPGLSIAWGPWAEVGLAAQQTNRGGRIAGQGLLSLRPREGMRLLAALLTAEQPFIAAMRFDAARWMDGVAGADAPLFEKLKVSTRSPGPEAAAVRTFRKAEDGRDMLDAMAAAQLAAVLRMGPEGAPKDKPFKALGLDSLMGLELRNRLERVFDLKLSASVIWNYPTLDQLCGYLAAQLGLEDGQPRDGETEDDPPEGLSLEDELRKAEALLAAT